MVALDLGFYDYARYEWKDDASHHSVSALPESFGQLEALRTLDLNENQLRTLPLPFGRLAALQNLELSYNKLSVLPDTFGQLAALQSLWLNSNQLSALPPNFLARATRVTQLRTDAGVQVCPPQRTRIGGRGDGQPARCVQINPQLSADRAALLDIFATGETDVDFDHPCTRTPCRPYDDWGASDDVCSWSGVTCGDAGNATRVVALDLGCYDEARHVWKPDDPSHHTVSALPESFGQLAALQTLDLNNNRLSALPESFGRLAALQNLELGGNQLSALPESFGQLAALQTLELNFNKLGALQESFGQLAALQSLELGWNELSALPESFGQLAALQRLFLSFNKLSALPKFLAHVTNLTSLSVDPSTRVCPVSQQLVGGNGGILASGNDGDEPARCVCEDSHYDASRAEIHCFSPDQRFAERLMVVTESSTCGVRQVPAVHGVQRERHLPARGLRAAGGRRRAEPGAERGRCSVRVPGRGVMRGRKRDNQLRCGLRGCAVRLVRLGRELRAGGRHLHEL